MNVLSLFSGIGTTELEMRRFGWETVAFCEIDPFARSILAKRFPGVPVFEDVTKLTGGDLNGRTIDIICGGFPCQDLSVAGRRRGLRNADGTNTRSGLWFEYLRLIRDIRPRYVLAENVRGAVNIALDTVTDGLHRAGYEVRTLLFPASACGAPHQRERIFIVGIRADVYLSLSNADERRCGKDDSMENTGHLPRSGAPHHGEPGAANESGAADEPKQSTAGGKRRVWPICGNRNPDAGGALNPNWVECLQGLPIGWTDLDADTPEPWPGWPAPPNAGGQFAYEPPRTMRGVKNGAKRLRALGNCNPPQQYGPAILFISSLADMLREADKKEE